MVLEGALVPLATGKCKVLPGPLLRKGISNWYLLSQWQHEAMERASASQPLCRKLQTHGSGVGVRWLPFIHLCLLPTLGSLPLHEELYTQVSCGPIENCCRQ